MAARSAKKPSVDTTSSLAGAVGEAHRFSADAHQRLQAYLAANIRSAGFEKGCAARAARPPATHSADRTHAHAARWQTRGAAVLARSEQPDIPTEECIRREGTCTSTPRHVR
jgi:hypothetical protein